MDPRRYVAVATRAALERLYAEMPGPAWDALEARCEQTGESIAEAVGSVAFHADRWQDVEMVEVK